MASGVPHTSLQNPNHFFSTMPQNAHPSSDFLTINYAEEPCFKGQSRCRRCSVLPAREVCERILDSGSDYFVVVKENQPTLRRDVQLASRPQDRQSHRSLTRKRLESPTTLRHVQYTEPMSHPAAQWLDLNGPVPIIHDGRSGSGTLSPNAVGACEPGQILTEAALSANLQVYAEIASRSPLWR